MSEQQKVTQDFAMSEFSLTLGISYLASYAKINEYGFVEAPYRKVKKLLLEHGYEVHERFPNRKSRDGKEQVSYEQLIIYNN